MLNNLVNIISGLEEISLETLMEGNYFVKERINEMGCITIKSSELISCYGFAVSALLLLNLQDVDYYVPAILVDDNFDDLTFDSKRFMVAHELGHYEKHSEKVTKPDYVRDINDEYEADEFAAEMIGYELAIKGLEDVKHILDETSCGTNILGMAEVDLRIENLRNKGMVLA